MMADPIKVTCKYSSGTYKTSKVQGQSASATQDAKCAVEALGRKLLPDQQFTVTQVDNENWIITPALEIKAVEVPEEFYRVSLTQPIVTTVAELKAQLDRLPDDMALRGTFYGEVLEMSVTNYPDNPTLCFESIEI